MGEVIYISSGKGGTGKSVFAVNMAAFLAMKNKKIALLDMDMGQGNVDLYLGLHNSVVYNIYDVLTGMCKLKQGLIKDRRFAGLNFMAAPPHINDGKVNEDNIEKLYSRLREKFDYIIVDGPSGMGKDMIMGASKADKIVLVSTADFAGIRGAEAVDMELRKTGVEKRFYVLNRIEEGHISKYGYPSSEDIKRSLRGKVIGLILEDEAVEISINLGIPAVMAEETPFAENMRRIVKRITNK